METHKVLCCQSGLLICRLQTPKFGFVGGDTITPTVEVGNVSSSTVAVVSLELKRKAAFTGELGGRKKVRYDTTLVAGIVFDSVGKKKVCFSGASSMMLLPFLF